MFQMFLFIKIASHVGDIYVYVSHIKRILYVKNASDILDILSMKNISHANMYIREKYIEY